MPEENKQEPKKIKWWWWLICGFVVFLMILWISNTDTSPNQTTNTPKQETKIDPVQERINRINELYAEEPSFDRVQKMDGSNSIAIIFK